MAIRNCAEIGENLQKIVSRLMANDDLVNLLYYTGQDPLSNKPLTNEQKQTLIFEKLIKIVPRVGPKETSESLLIITVPQARTNQENSEFRNIQIEIEVIVPLTQWIIKNSNLRPFAILGEVQKSLNNKTINGLGKMTGGNFDLNFITEEVCSYKQYFSLVSYE